MGYFVRPLKRESSAGIVIHAEDEHDKRAEAYLLGLRKDGVVELIRVPLGQAEAELGEFNNDVEMLFEYASPLAEKLEQEDRDSDLSPEEIQKAIDAMLAGEEGGGS